MGFLKEDNCCPLSMELLHKLGSFFRDIQASDIHGENFQMFYVSGLCPYFGFLGSLSVKGHRASEDAAEQFGGTGESGHQEKTEKG